MKRGRGRAIAPFVVEEGALRHWSAWTVLAAFLGCGESGPIDPGLGSTRVTDPPGDTFETASSADLVPPDIVGLSIDRTATLLRIELAFADPVSPDPSSRNFLSGFFELDLDQDVATGLRPSLIEQLQPAGRARALGVEVEIDFLSDGRVRVFDPIAGEVVGFVTPRYEGSRVALDVPLALLDDDGLVTLAAIVGTLAEPTDVVPNIGVVRLELP